MPAYKRVLYVFQMKSETDYDRMIARRQLPQAVDPRPLDTAKRRWPRWTGHGIPIILIDIEGNTRSTDEEARINQQDQHAAIAGWDEPEGLNPRGTVIIPGRGERPGVYERFGRRMSADAYRVRAVASPGEDPALTEVQVRSLLDGPKPVVLAGSDTGALFAAALVASGRLPEAAALVLAGLPTEPAARPVVPRAAKERRRPRAHRGLGIPPPPRASPRVRHHTEQCR
jgi:hypothetical protein